MRIYVGPGSWVLGPGSWVYYTRHGEVVYFLLLGDEKSSQKRDIGRAIEMTKNWN